MKFKKKLVTFSSQKSTNSLGRYWQSEIYNKIGIGQEQGLKALKMTLKLENTVWMDYKYYNMNMSNIKMIFTDHYHLDDWDCFFPEHFLGFRIRHVDTSMSCSSCDCDSKISNHGLQDHFNQCRHSVLLLLLYVYIVCQTKALFIWKWFGVSNISICYL